MRACGTYLQRRGLHAHTHSPVHTHLGTYASLVAPRRRRRRRRRRSDTKPTHSLEQRGMPSLHCECSAARPVLEMLVPIRSHFGFTLLQQ